LKSQVEKGARACMGFGKLKRRKRIVYADFTIVYFMWVDGHGVYGVQKQESQEISYFHSRYLKDDQDVCICRNQ